MRDRVLQACLLLLLFATFTACASPANPIRDTGPRLVQEVTLPPPTASWQTNTTVVPPTAAPLASISQPTETRTPVRIVTIDSGFVLVTPTLPPSKTPTSTPTQSRTPTSTPDFYPLLIPTVSLLVPTNVIASPAPAVVFPPANQLSNLSLPALTCPTNWFFSNTLVQTCPLNPPLISAAAALSFERGYMVWVQEQSAIYVMYNDAALPAWEVFPDRFEEGMPERDNAIQAPPPLWQPKRGFGLVWRTYEHVRRRLGWALRDDEEGFTTQVQIGADGTVYVADPQRGVFALTPAGTDWQRLRG